MPSGYKKSLICEKLFPNMEIVLWLEGQTQRKTKYEASFKEKKV